MLKHFQFPRVLGRFILLSLIVGPRPAGGDEPQDVVVVDDFDDGIQNHLLGYRSAFERSPSSAKAERVSGITRGLSGRSWRIDARRAESGFCGGWIHFFDFRSPTRCYCDATKFSYLSFWVKGAAGGESFTVKLADRQWVEREDAVAVGHINRLLPGGVTRDWREVIVPLTLATGLDRRQLAGLTLEFTTPGRFKVYIDDVSFKTRRDATVRLSRSAPAKVPVRIEYPRSMWIWSTRPLLTNTDARETLFDFCHRRKIKNLWMQLDYSMKSEVAMESEGMIPAEVSCRIKHPPRLRSFLREAHRRGLTIHALDGLPEFALKERHHEPLAVIDAVIAWNAHSLPAERFDGIHFDNEPNLLVGWQSPRCRQQILKEFLDLNVECQRRVRQRSQMTYGIDIPFWWNEHAPGSSEPIANVEYHGQRKPASFHCIDLLDQVGIMNYRDTADGPDGMIAHGRDLLRCSDKVGGAKIIMGVETFAADPTRVWFDVGLPHRVFVDMIEKFGHPLARRSRIGGLMLHTLDDGKNVHVGVEMPNVDSTISQTQVQATLLELARQFGCGSRHELNCNPQQMRNLARAHIQNSPILQPRHHSRWG